MSRLKPIDLSFLLMENSSRQMHMTAYQMFKIPANQKNSFVPKLLKTYRNSEVAEPFNQKVKWLSKSVASWQKVQPDLVYHIRHVAVPTPGTLQQFYALVSFLNTTLLDRAQPLWECYIIEGIEGNQCAIMIKVHHALIDGGGALQLFRNSMSDSARDKAIRAIWMPSDTVKPRRTRSRVSESQLKKLVSTFGKLPSGILGAATEFANMGAQSLKLKPKTSALPFGANRTIFNNAAQSSARRYANCEIPLDRVKAIAKATDTTVNDVVTTIIDDGLHHYLNDQNASIDVPLVTLMAMSMRTADQKAAGNQVSVELVPMGQPKAAIGKRLQQVHDSIQQVKDKSRKLPSAVRQFYSLFIFGSATLSDISATLEAIPSANLIISNMVGPQEQLYMGGVPMVAFQGLPIVPPGGGLNVTFASVNKDLCLAVGATPEAVNDPYKLIQFILHGFEKLQKVTTKDKPKARKTPAKK
ncbi:MAG: wax ester/triacylglycerol synthase family O-acyltransferase [Pseudomonadales bacterium]